MDTTNVDLNKEFIESVRHATDIVQVIGHHVRITKKGNSHVGLCPFHKEKTPSFHVIPGKQIYHCFGCRESGDVFSFLQKMEGLNFPEAVVELAQRAGITIPRKSARSRGEQLQRQILLSSCQAAAEFFQNNLQDPANESIREYLRERGITEDTIQSYQIGYAPEGYENLLNALRPEHEPAVLEKTGLIQKSQKGSGYYDRFRGRVMIPIRNVSGSVIAFGGRAVGDGEPKYLNSPDTTLFHKSNVLFGLHEGYRIIRKKGFVVIVEGYFDAIMLHQHGFLNTVAPLGTSFGDRHADILSRYCEKAVIAMDSDSAGRGAALKAASILLKKGFAVNILSLPQGEDPDSLVQRQGAEALKNLLKRSSSVARFALAEAKSRFDTTAPAGKQAALGFMAPILGSFGNPIQRADAITLASEELGIAEHIVLAAIANERRDSGEEDQPMPAIIDPVPRYEREIMEACVKKPEISKKAIEDYGIYEYLSSFTQKVLTAIWEHMDAGENWNTRDLIAVALNDAEKQLITQMIISETDEELIDPETCARGIAIEQHKQQFKQISARIAAYNEDAKTGETLDDLYTAKSKLAGRIMELEEEAGEKN